MTRWIRVLSSGFPGTIGDAAVMFGLGVCLDVKSEICLAFRFIRPVAGITVCRKNRQNIPAKTHGIVSLQIRVGCHRDQNPDDESPVNRAKHDLRSGLKDEETHDNRDDFSNPCESSQSLCGG